MNDKNKTLREIRELMLTPITKEQIEKVLLINECLTPEHWNRGMFDSFMLGNRLGKQEAREGKDKIIKGKSPRKLIIEQEMRRLLEFA